MRSGVLPGNLCYEMKSFSRIWFDFNLHHKIRTITLAIKVSAWLWLVHWVIFAALMSLVDITVVCGPLESIGQSWSAGGHQHLFIHPLSGELQCVCMVVNMIITWLMLFIDWDFHFNCSSLSLKWCFSVIGIVSQSGWGKLVLVQVKICNILMYTWNKMSEAAWKPTVV